MQTLSNTRPKRRFGTWFFRLVYLSLIIVGIAVYAGLRSESDKLDKRNEMLSKAATIVGKAQIGSTAVTIPTKDFFAAGEMWTLASRTHPLPEYFSVRDLVASPTETGGGEKLQVAKRIVKPLQALVDAADADGHYLMISSAYRSIQEQEDTYASYVSRYGEQVAKEYVSPPRASEHHTGLAIDFSDYSDACEQDSEKCSLGMDSAAWLLENAPRYGFVLRYPDGKKDITGVGYEWWHFRYVGVPLAKAVAASDLTLDEALEKMQAR
jgi:D-alanyl-D-alanine carboxypeptidase